jgi:hypothetical protein
MDTILTRAGDVPVTRTPAPEADGITRTLGRFLLTMAQTAAERLVSPQRDPPPSKWYRLPLP